MSVLIKILKFIGKALLWVLAVILVILAVILICPIKYEIKGEKYENISFKGRIKLFFGILTVKFKASAKGLDGIKVELFGKKLGGKKKKKAVDKDKETAQKKTEPNDSQNEKPEAEPEKKSENEPAKTEEKTETTEKPKPAETVKKVSDEWNDKKPTGNSAKVRRIKLSDAEKNIAENKKNETAVKKISLSEEEKAERKEEEKTDTDSEKNKEEKKPEKLDLDYFIKMPMADKKQLFKAVVKLLKSLLKGIKPDDFYVKGDVGLEDPSTTAEVVGAIYAFSGIVNKQIDIKAVFDKEILQGEAYAKGKIIPIYMLVCLIRFALTKQIRKIIKIYLKGSGDKNGK